MFNKLKKIMGISPELTPEMVVQLRDKIGPFEYFPDQAPETIRFIESLFKALEVNTILDPQCGSGILLHRLKRFKSSGYDVDHEALEMAKYLNPNSVFEIKNYLKHPIKEKFDAIVTNIMLFGPISKEIEQRIISMIRDGLNDNGVFVLITTINFLTSSIYHLARNTLKNKVDINYIIDIPISKPSVSNIKQILIVGTKGKKDNKVFLADLRESTVDQVLAKDESISCNFWLYKSNLEFRWDRNYHNPEFIEYERELNRNDTLPLEKLAEVIMPGIFVPKEKRKLSGEFKIISPGNIQESLIVDTDRDYFCDNLNIRNFENRKIGPGDILLTAIGPKYKACIVPAEFQPSVPNQNIFVIRAKDNQYLNMFLNSNTGFDNILKQIRRRSRGGVIERISIRDLKEIIIPIYPIDNLNNIALPKEVFQQPYESHIASLLISKLENLGWDVRKEYRLKDNVLLDLALFAHGELTSFVEIKGRDAFAHGVKNLQHQLNKYIEQGSMRSCYCFFDNQFYEYSDNHFLPLEKFPSPPPSKEEVEAQKHIRYSLVPKKFIDSPDNLAFVFFMELMTKYLADFENVKNDIAEIKEISTRTEEKVNLVLDTVTELQNNFNHIKNGPSLIDDKLHMLNDELDKKINLLRQDNAGQLKQYESALERWFKFEWDKLEDLSKSYLPPAEFLLEQLSRMNISDLSPFIIQYCRALENELLQKIFRAFVHSLIKRGVRIDEIFAWDLGTKESGKPNNSNTQKLAKYLKKCLDSDESKWFFELGTMEVNLRYLKGNSVKKSPLLKDLRSFVLEYFEDDVMAVEFLDELKRITIEYRNRAAHPGQISLEEAKIGQKDIRELLKAFLESYKM